MELWIRSQDKKELVKVNNLAVIENRMVFINNGNGRATLGTYKTKERALEVLDEIQKHLIPKILLENKSWDIQEIKILPEIYVYEMPKE